MKGLEKRITEALDFAEQQAKAVDPRGPWWHDTDGTVYSDYLGTEFVPEHEGPLCTPAAKCRGRVTAIFIARWNPKHIRDMVRMDREILTRHALCEPVNDCPDMAALAARWGVTP